MAEVKGFPGWESVRIIGHGSFGSVHEIQRALPDGTVEKAALKIISIPQHSGDIDELYNDGFDEESITTRYRDYLGSIVREYSLMKTLRDCVNVVNCDDLQYFAHDDGIGWDIYIKMELLTPLGKALGNEITEDETLVAGSLRCRRDPSCLSRS